MYNSCQASEGMFRRMFQNMSAVSFIEKEFLFQHQIHLLSGQGSLRELMLQVIQKHNRFFALRFSVQRICPLHIENKKDVAELVRKYNSHSEVCNFLRIILFAVFPYQLFGTKKQRRKFYRSLTLLVTSAYTVRFKYKNMVRGMLMEKITWLAALESQEAKRSVFGSFTKWAVDYFIDMMKGFFYATETQYGKFEIFFYQKHVWRGICEYSMTSGLSLTTAAVTYEKTRLIPKKSSVRMICPDQSLETETEIREHGALVSVLQMLRSDSRPLIFDNFSEFCDTVRQMPTSQLFMIKADIRDCYPCIRQDVLADIISKKVSCFFGKRSCGLIRCQEIHSVFANCGSLKIQTQFIPILHREDKDQQETADLITDQEFNFAALRNRILVPSAVIAIQDPVQKIISQFKGNVIKKGKNFYLLSEGIRQGGRLSPELCYLYMESFLCSMFRDVGRLHIALKADDILIACCDKEQAEIVLQRILDGSHKFNFRANREKIFTNFDSKNCVQVQSLIPFCGSLYDCDSRSVIADFTRFHACHLKYSFNCNPFQKARIMAKYVAGQFSHMRSHLTDSGHNDADVVVRNLYERSLFQGMRFACFLLASDSHKASQDAKLLEYFANLLTCKAYKLYCGWGQRQGSDCMLLSELEVHFICSSAIL